MIEEPVWVTRYITDRWKTRGVMEVRGHYSRDGAFLYRDGEWRCPPKSAVFETKLLAMQRVVHLARYSVQSAEQELAKAQHRYEELKTEYEAMNESTSTHRHCDHLPHQ